MSKFKVYITLLILVIITNCAPIKVSSNQTANTDFSNLKSYAWGKNSLTMDRLGRSVNDIIQQVENMARRDIQPITDNELTSKGFHLMAEGDPDFIVRYTARGQSQSGLPNANFTASESTYMTNSVGTFLIGVLAIQIVDPKTQQVIWTGYGEGTIKGTGTNNKRLKKAIRKILKDFPPK